MLSPYELTHARPRHLCLRPPRTKNQGQRQRRSKNRRADAGSCAVSEGGQIASYVLSQKQKRRFVGLTDRAQSK